LSKSFPHVFIQYNGRCIPRGNNVADAIMGVLLLLIKRKRLTITHIYKATWAT